MLLFYFCSKVGKRDCTPNKLITIDPTIDLQATDVHCQAFLGFLLRELSKNPTKNYSLKDALDRFCPRYFQLKLFSFLASYIHVLINSNIIDKIIYHQIQI